MGWGLACSVAYVSLKKPIKLISVLLLPVSPRGVQSALNSCCRGKPSCAGLVSQWLTQRSAVNWNSRPPFTAGHLALPHWAEQGSWEWAKGTGKHLIRCWAARGETLLCPREQSKESSSLHTVSGASPEPHCLPSRPQSCSAESSQPQRILAPHTEVQAKPLPISFQVLVYMDTVVQKIKGSALVTDIKPALDSHISSTASCSLFSCCTIQPTLLLKRRDKLPFWELLPCTDLSFLKRRLFLLHMPRMSQILSVPSWEAV